MGYGLDPESGNESEGVSLCWKDVEGLRHADHGLLCTDYGQRDHDGLVVGLFSYDVKAWK